jgi:hypothetical protein
MTWMRWCISRTAVHLWWMWGNWLMSVGICLGCWMESTSWNMHLQFNERNRVIHNHENNRDHLSDLGKRWNITAIVSPALNPGKFVNKCENAYCQQNPRLPRPNPSKLLTRPDQTYPLIHPATHSAHACSTRTIATPPPPASLYILPHRWTHRPTRWTIRLTIIDAYHLDYLIPYSLPPSCLLASLFCFH